MRTELTEAECLSILGVPGSATMDVITEAYRYRRAANHPDKFQSERHKAQAEEEFKRITTAYERLLVIRRERGSRDSGTRGDSEAGARPANWIGIPIWKHWWWRSKSMGTAGPPPRSSPGTRWQWPHLKSLHRRWFFPCTSNRCLPEVRFPREDWDSLTKAATDYVNRAKLKHLEEELYWVAEAEQNEKVCYLRFLNHVIGDLYSRVEVVLAKQKNLTYVELKLSTTLWWRPSVMLQRFGKRSFALLAWLAFGVLVEVLLTSGTGGAAVGAAIAGLLVIAGIAHWDFYVDYGRVDWKRLYPFGLWRRRFEIPAMIQVAGFFLWRYLANLLGHDPGPRTVYLPVLLWICGYWLWKSARLVDYPEEDLGVSAKPKDVEAYLEAIKSMFSDVDSED